jgi:hypothetical protein
MMVKSDLQEDTTDEGASKVLHDLSWIYLTEPDPKHNGAAMRNERLAPIWKCNSLRLTFFKQLRPNRPVISLPSFATSGYSRCCGPPSKVKRLENCAAQHSSKSSPACPEMRCTYPGGACEGENAFRGYSVALRSARRNCDQST